MKNLDLKNNFATQMAAAVAANDNAAIAKAWTDYAEALEASIMEDARALVGEHDAGVLASRGIRQLTSEETSYYQRLADYVRADDPRQAFTGTDNVIPKTVIDAIFDDIRHSHPLLDAINFTSTAQITEMLLNTNTKQIATWGELDSEITKELSGGFKKVSFSMYKLSAYMVIAKSMLDLGPQYMDSFVRQTLAESLAWGLEDGIVNGTGNKQPIGMIKKLTGAVDGVYPTKTEVTVNALDVTAFASILNTLTVDDKGFRRNVGEILIVCNPADYCNKVYPATTVLAPDGTYRNDVFPRPVRVVQSAQVAEGKAIFGIASRYWMGMGSGTGGKLEYTDDRYFLEDKRAYLIKLYGYGQALDENAFIYADISGLKPFTHKVSLVDGDGAAVYINPDARLSSLTIGSLPLSPAFNKSTHNYTATTTAATNTINAVAKDGESAIVIKNGAATVANGAAATWVSDANTVTVTVTNGDEDEVYTVVVTKS